MPIHREQQRQQHKNTFTLSDRLQSDPKHTMCQLCPPTHNLLERFLLPFSVPSFSQLHVFPLSLRVFKKKLMVVAVEVVVFVVVAVVRSFEYVLLFGC